MAAILAALLPAVLPALGTILTGLLAWAASSIAKKNAASAQESKVLVAGLKLAAIVTALLQKGWEHIGPEVQTALADGKLDAAERAAIESSVQELLKDATDEATLKEIGDALGLPLAGIVAKIASHLIEKWTSAHDPSITTASANAFPTPAMLSASPDVAAG
jgi:hypothetical protein